MGVIGAGSGSETVRQRRDAGPHRWRDINEERDMNEEPETERVSGTPPRSPDRERVPETPGSSQAARINPRDNVQRPVDLRIDELVLEGFSFGDRFRIGEAIENELTRLLAEHGAPASLTKDSESSSLDGLVIRIPSNAKATTIGAQVARSIYRGLAR